MTIFKFLLRSAAPAAFFKHKDSLHLFSAYAFILLFFLKDVKGNE
jgi:hypothetical protein